MAALVANYGSSSSEGESEDEVTVTKETAKPKESGGVNLLTSTNTDSEDEHEDSDKLTSSRVSLPKKSQEKSTESKLPLPSFMTQDLNAFTSVANQTSSPGTKSTLPSSSVFANPFEKAERQKLSILEQHVKLSSAEKTEAEMGKKICWMFRKGRCRFGHKCKFAHDNDIKLKQTSQEQEGEIPPAPVTDMGGGRQHPGQHFQRGQFVAEGFGGGDSNEDEVQSKKRKKPGLAHGLVPPKKSMLAYQQQAAHERPWTMSKK